ncbi:MAG: NACHT domain-containing protein [Synechococcales cyanobacterium RU_4_20]|nr:NACHT domain-containing protein [Synechococcales cyanobacterium RU_4_20]
MLNHPSDQNLEPSSKDHQYDHPHNTSAIARSRNEKILLKAVRAEVRDSLAQSLHHNILINLPKAFQADRVRRPWDMEIKVGDRPARPLGRGETIVDVFDDEAIGSKLWILGQPGAGKTTTLLDLTETLLTRAERSAKTPIPVLFNLLTWNGREPFSDWLVQQLQEKYGVRPKLGKAWLAKQKLLPLIDGWNELELSSEEDWQVTEQQLSLRNGWDEMKPSSGDDWQIAEQKPLLPEALDKGRGGICVQRLNEWLGSGECPDALVVCSRPEACGHYKTDLGLNGAVCLRPLSDTQVEEYLRDVGKPELGAAVTRDGALQEMLRVPLYLSMAVLAYDEAFGRSGSRHKRRRRGDRCCWRRMP